MSAPGRSAIVLLEIGRPLSRMLSTTLFVFSASADSRSGWFGSVPGSCPCGVTTSPSIMSGCAACSWRGCAARTSSSVRPSSKTSSGSTDCSSLWFWLAPGSWLRGSTTVASRISGCDAGNKRCCASLTQVCSSVTGVMSRIKVLGRLDWMKPVVSTSALVKNGLLNGLTSLGTVGLRSVGMTIRLPPGEAASNVPD